MFLCCSVEEIVSVRDAAVCMCKHSSRVTSIPFALSLSLPLQHSSFIHLCVQYKTSFFFRLPTADCDSYHKETEKRERRHAGGGGAIKENASHNPNEPFI